MYRNLMTMVAHCEPYVAQGSYLRAIFNVLHKGNRLVRTLYGVSHARQN